MTLFKHELRQSRSSLAIWTGSIALLMAVCLFLFPEMKDEMRGVSNLFASMGAFTKAFGMDRLNFGTLIGFYAIECGNIVGLGGAFFAAMTAGASLSKEEEKHTAEFLLTHPVHRARIVTEKLLAIMAQILLMNAVLILVSIACISVVGETIPWKELLLLHAAYLLMQIELAGICFGISAFSRRGTLGVGLGIAVMAYFLNLIANLSDSARAFKYITPFGYAEGADIVADGALSLPLVLTGMVLCAMGILTAYARYSTKDIH